MFISSSTALKINKGGFRMNTFCTALITMLFLHSAQVWGWGQYGHEQVNSAAIDLLDPSLSMTKCFRDARHMMIRYAITPDVEWKANVKIKNITRANFLSQRSNDCVEHPFHFFEADAFAKPDEDVTKLPCDGDYGGRAYQKYSQLMKKNMDHVVLVDPSKRIQNPDDPTPKDVAEHGTAPWRIRSLYLASVKAMKSGDFRLAALYLGSIGHYVADMTQPFHSTLNFDGDYKPQDEHSGIHHEIDTGLLFRVVSSKKDADSVFLSFSETHAPVLESAKRKLNEFPEHFSETDIIPSVMKLVASSLQLIDPLLQAYKKQCDLANKDIPRTKRAPSSTPPATSPEEIPAPVVEIEPVVPTRFCERSSGKKYSRVRSLRTKNEDALNATKLGSEGTVLQVIEGRLALAAALTSKLWAAAFSAAGHPDFGNCTGDDWKFSQSYAIQKYLRPDYYPEGFNGNTRRGCSNNFRPSLDEE